MKSYLIFFLLLGVLQNSAVLECRVPLSLSDVADYPLIDISSCKEEDLKTSSWVDFDTMCQHFVLDTKKIEIPGHPFAFNPSITRWRGALLMSFRTYDPQTHSTNPFGLVWLNENFEPIGIPQLFELPFKNPLLSSKQQDPRLITVGDRLFILYNNILEQVTHREMRRMFVVEINYDGVFFTASEPQCLSHFEGENAMRYEKNWVPFAYHNDLYLSYSLLPHKILHPLFGQNACETLHITNRHFPWEWGVPRGGTPAIREGDHYIAFFHSWMDLPSVQSSGKKIAHYVMGAYTFASTPPFSLIAVSPQPIVAKNFYQPPYYKTWKPLRCVFPAGIVLDEHYLWVAYGRQDHEVWIMKLNKKELLKSLIPVSSKQGE
jgi:predicted GH43/DUF377 family glycosyl hydrolase